MEVGGVYASVHALDAGLTRRAVDVALISCEQDAPRKNGLAFIRVLQERHPGTRFLVCCSVSCSVLRVRALLYGARGFVSMEHGAHAVVAAVRTVFAGAVYPDIRTPAATLRVRAKRSGGRGLLGASQALSQREQDVIRCYLQGMTITAIAAKFNRSVKTVSTQKSTAFRKLGVSTYAELFRLHAERGIG